MSRSHVVTFEFQLRSNSAKLLVVRMRISEAEGKVPLGVIQLRTGARDAGPG